LTGTLTHFYRFAAELLRANGGTGIFLARGLVLCLLFPDDPANSARGAAIAGHFFEYEKQATRLFS
jgi:hypothetical protein